MLCGSELPDQCSSVCGSVSDGPDDAALLQDEFTESDDTDADTVEQLFDIHTCFFHNEHDAADVLPNVAVEVFTDGSGQDVEAGDLNAGWGVSIILADRQWHELGGVAPRTNNEGELTAILEACEWLLTLCASGRCPHGAVLIRYDSEYAAFSATGRYDGTKNRDLIMAVRSALARLRSVRDVWFMHVKAHSNVAGNDRADELAAMGKRGSFVRSGVLPLGAPISAWMPGRDWDYQDALDTRGKRQPLDFWMDPVAYVSSLWFTTWFLSSLYHRISVRSPAPTTITPSSMQKIFTDAFRTTMVRDLREVYSLLRPDSTPSGNPRLRATWVGAIVHACFQDDCCATRMCPRGHLLVPFASWIGVEGALCRCDQCFEFVQVGSLMWGCRRCDYDSCSSCFHRLHAALSPAQAPSGPAAE